MSLFLIDCLYITKAEFYCVRTSTTEGLPFKKFNYSSVLDKDFLLNLARMVEKGALNSYRFY